MPNKQSIWINESAHLLNVLRYERVYQEKYGRVRGSFSEMCHRYEDFQPKWEVWEPVTRKPVKVLNPEEWL